MDVLQVIRKNPSQTTEVDLKEEIYCLLLNDNKERLWTEQIIEPCAAMTV
jgi:hypothetical protein